MTGLAIEFEGFSPMWAKALAASLPASVRMVDGGGDVVLIAGEGAWPDRLIARLRAGYTRFIVCDPQASAAGQADEALAEARAKGARITLCETHADNPALPAFRAGLTGPYSAVTITGEGDDSPAHLLLQQLRLARAAGFAAHACVHSAADVGRALATLQAAHGGEEVLLRLTVSVGRAGAARHRLLTHGRTQSDGIEVWSQPAARPAQAFHIDGDTAAGQPTLYESAHRAVLRAVVAGRVEAPGGEALRAWIHDARLALAMAAH